MNLSKSILNAKGNKCAGVTIEYLPPISSSIINDSYPTSLTYSLNNPFSLSVVTIILSLISESLYFSFINSLINS